MYFINLLLYCVLGVLLAQGGIKFAERPWLTISILVVVIFIEATGRRYISPF